MVWTPKQKKEWFIRKDPGLSVLQTLHLKEKFKHGFKKDEGLATSKKNCKLKTVFLWFSVKINSMKWTIFIEEIGRLWLKLGQCRDNSLLIRTLFVGNFLSTVLVTEMMLIAIFVTILTLIHLQIKNIQMFNCSRQA